MRLWIHWWNVVVLLKPACSRARTFMWFVTCIAGFTTRTDMLGVSSMIRSLGLHARYYDNLLNNFHSQGIKLDEMTRLWVKLVITLFTGSVQVNGRIVLVGDGIKIPKQGKKMPGVKRLHQESESNTNGKKVKLKSLFREQENYEEMESPVYGEKGVTITFQVYDLLWKPAGTIVRFVLVNHPTRGQCILMSTDMSLSAEKIIYLYGLRFKIEHTFKQSVRVLGIFSYHFWMKGMKPLRRNNGNQYLHKESKHYREAVQRKLHSYHVFILAGSIAQGLLQYLSAVHTKEVWSTFGSWLRTIRPGVAPSEFVVAIVLRQSFPEFLLANSQSNNLAKFITERQDLDRMNAFRNTA